MRPRGERPVSRSRCFGAGLVAAGIFALAPTAASALTIGAGTTTGPAAPAPSPSAAQPGQGTTSDTAATRTVRIPIRSLRVGARGPQVRDLQRELRRRGFRAVRVDGAFGPSTRNAVRAQQTRMRIRPANGIATVAFQRRLGIQVSRVATAPVNTPPASGARYLRTFPVLGKYRYSNDFGAPRHQGRHQGTDVVAQRGTPVVAVAPGTITRLTRTERGLGGIYIWLRDGSGTDYYYAHLNSISAGLREGSRVAVGQVIGTVGQTGDARGTVDHLHFEIRPRGQGSINPYPELRAVDPKAS